MNLQKVWLPTIGWGVFLILLLINFSWADFAALLRAEAFLPGLQLFFAAVLLTAIGHCGASLFKLNLKSPITALLLGQVLCMFWIYLRSGINLLASNWLGFSIPFSPLELLPLAAGCWWITTNRSTPSIPECGRRRLLTLDIIPLLVICFLSAQRELPRLSVLSSDPDLHVFWAMQLVRQGGIPETLGAWGPEGLRYPAGFSVLNYLWASFSRLDMLQIVSVQTLLQAQLAVLLLMSAGSFLIRFKRNDKIQNLLISLFGIACFYFLLPYGYNKHFFQLEGTARTSSLLLISGMFLSTAALFFRSAIYRTPAILLSALISMFLIGINPIHVLIAGPCFLFCLFAALWQCFRAAEPKALILLCFPLLLLCDPYFWSHQEPTSSLSLALPQISLLDLLLSKILDTLTHPLASIAEAWTHYFSIDFYPPWVTHALAFTLVAVSFAFYLPRRGSWKVLALTLTFASLVVILIALVIVPVFKPLSGHPNYRLLLPYGHHFSQQAIYAWVFFLLGLSTHILTRRFGVFWLLSLSIPTLLFLRGIQEKHASLGREPRHALESGMAFPTPDDRVVIGQIEKLHADFRNRQPNLDFLKSPKILIPNMMHDTGWEQWLFPYGGTRLLPLKDVFPLAFYYQQGFADFNFLNYRNKICRRFDLQWLKERNVRYLFVPSHRGPICIHGLDKLLQNNTIIFQSGNSMFVQLF